MKNVKLASKRFFDLKVQGLVIQVSGRVYAHLKVVKVGVSIALEPGKDWGAKPRAM